MSKNKELLQKLNAKNAQFELKKAELEAALSKIEQLEKSRKMLLNEILAKKVYIEPARGQWVGEDDIKEVFAKYGITENAKF